MNRSTVYHRLRPVAGQIVPVGRRIDLLAVGVELTLETLDEITEAVRQLGSALGRAEAAQRVVTRIDQARSRYDWVIIDSPPALGLSDASVIATLTDGIVDGYFPVLDRIEDEIDALQDDVIRKPSSWTLERVFALKRELVGLRRAMELMLTGDHMSGREAAESGVGRQQLAWPWGASRLNLP